MKFPVEIGGKEYTKQQLIGYGKATYPKLYWIPRGIGLANMITGLLVVLISLLGLSYAHSLEVQYNTTVDKSELIVYLVGAICDLVIGCIVFAISFNPKHDEDYINHAVRKLKAANRVANMYTSAPQEVKEQPQVKDEDDPKIEELKKYKRLLDEGLITQEVYDAKKEEYLNGR